MLVLYILGRNDLDSLGKGKFGAQCAHVQSVFDDRFFHYALRQSHRAKKELKLSKAEQRELDMFLAWKSQEGRFGTVITKAVDLNQMRTAVEIAKRCGFLAEIVIDPSYPLLDGEDNAGRPVIHEFPLETGAFIFGDSDDPILKAIVRPLPLYPVLHRGQTS